MSEDVIRGLGFVQAVGRWTLGVCREAGHLALFAGRGVWAAVTPPIFTAQIMRQLMQVGYLSLPVVGLPRCSRARPWR